MSPRVGSAVQMTHSQLHVTHRIYTRVTHDIFTSYPSHITPSCVTHKTFTSLCYTHRIHTRVTHDLYTSHASRYLVSHTPHSASSCHTSHPHLCYITSTLVLHMTSTNAPHLTSRKLVLHITSSQFRVAHFIEPSCSTSQILKLHMMPTLVLPRAPRVMPHARESVMSHLYV